MGTEQFELNEARTAYLARWEPVEAAKAQEIAAMTEERAWQIIRSLHPLGPVYRDPINGMGLVEQQAIFHGRKPGNEQVGTGAPDRRTPVVRSTLV